MIHAFQYICTSIFNLFEMYYSGNDVRQKLKYRYKENLNMFFFLFVEAKMEVLLISQMFPL